MCEKSLEMRHFRIFSCPEEVELAASRNASVGRDGTQHAGGTL